MRESCFDCARKHLAQALVVSHELPHYAADEKDDHLWVFVGHMAEAADQVQKSAPNVAEQIRTLRLQVMDDLNKIYTLDLNGIIREISEIASIPVSDEHERPEGALSSEEIDELLRATHDVDDFVVGSLEADPTLTYGHGAPMRAADSALIGDDSQ